MTACGLFVSAPRDTSANEYATIDAAASVRPAHFLVFGVESSDFSTSHADLIACILDGCRLTFAVQVPDGVVRA